MSTGSAGVKNKRQICETRGCRKVAKAPNPVRFCYPCWEAPLPPETAVARSTTLIEALGRVDPGLVGDGGGPTFDTECGADAMREVCIRVVALWNVR